MIDTAPSFGGKSTLVTLESKTDNRAQVAKVTVEAGAALLGMRQADAGLESIFMKMIQSGQEEPRG